MDGMGWVWKSLKGPLLRAQLCGAKKNIPSNVNPTTRIFNSVLGKLGSGHLGPG